MVRVTHTDAATRDAAVLELYDRYGGRLYGIGLRLLGNRGLAEELVQETFVKAFAEKARAAYDGLQPYRPYLLRITKNLMIDRFRSEQRHVGNVELDKMSVGDIDTILATDADFARQDETPDLHWKSLLAAANEYVATLDAESRQLVALRFEEGLSQDDVATRMTCSRRRVRTVEHRVQHSLRKWLQKRGLLES